ncbi:hypothetical protein D0T66_12750 [Dysgonomonas sp. 25]|nr:hypothetical protein [Dysgonomonas sp. 25]
MIILGISTANAQCDLPYKSLPEFNKDTTSFIIYNFLDRSDCYKDKTMEELYNELLPSIKYITESAQNKDIIKLYIYLYNESNSEPIYICWEKEDLENIDLPKNEIFFYEKYKNNKIREIGVILSPNHKDYQRYYSQKKSRTFKEPRGYIKNGRMVYRWKTGK